MTAEAAGTAASSSGQEGHAGRDRGEGPAGRELRTTDFEYELPGGRIARFPADRRDESRLLVIRRDGGPGSGAGSGPTERGVASGGAAPGRRGAFEDRRFRELPDLVPAGDALVLNDTRVLPARLLGRKPTGASGEVLLLRPVDDGEGRRWEALVRPGGKLKPGRTLVVHDELRVEIEAATGSGGRLVRLVGEGDPRELVERHGRMPIPPYLERPSVPLDRERYQTVYAAEDGSVAAPTAGLHFTRPLLGRLEAKGVRLVRITLHVGVGTFRPVDAERPEDHELHEESFRVSGPAAAALNEVREAGGAVWAVGTTAARTLETVADEAGRFRAAGGRTDLFIHPPYRFRGVDRLVTNFHLPRSSLLMLVSAFAGHRRTLAAYRHAVDAGYRFYSYGDAMAVV